MDVLTEREQQRVEENIGLADALACNYVYYASSRVHRITGRGELLDELKSVAYDGLITAARTFDPNRNTKFSSWAYISIKYKLYRFVCSSEFHEEKEIPTQEEALVLLAGSIRDEGLQEDVECASVIEWMSEHLPPVQAEVLRLLYGGLTQSEIARKLNLPVSTIKGRIVRMRDRLEMVFNSTFGASHERRKAPPRKKRRQGGVRE